MERQWNTEIKRWLGTQVSVFLLTGVRLVGELRWIDRYTLCLLGSVPAIDGQNKTIIVHKGAVAFMYQETETVA